MSSDYFIQLSFAKQLGARLERFKIKKESPFLAVARCPICNEGTSKTKTRFSIYSKNSELNCACFNCGLSTTLPKFLKLHYPQLFDEFKFDTFRVKQTAPVITVQKEFTPAKSVIKSNTALDLPLISELPADHIAAKYISSRLLPPYPFYFADRFYNFSSQFNDSFSTTNDEPRIIIPFFDRSGSIFAYQGRDLSDRAKQKYITVKIREKAALLFGFEKLDVEKQILLVEGPLDSLFLPNCIASVNASLATTAKWFCHGINKPLDTITIVLDNEPRNKSVLKEYELAIESGFKTVIWPKSVESYKDVNAMIMAGLDPYRIIKKNTFQGLTASINFNNFKKV